MLPPLFFLGFKHCSRASNPNLMLSDLYPFAFTEVEMHPPGLLADHYILRQRGVICRTEIAGCKAGYVRVRGEALHLTSVLDRLPGTNSRRENCFQNYLYLTVICKAQVYSLTHANGVCVVIHSRLSCKVWVSTVFSNGFHSQSLLFGSTPTRMRTWSFNSYLTINSGAGTPAPLGQNTKVNDRVFFSFFFATLLSLLDSNLHQ
jgi:hypothetical protein